MTRHTYAVRWDHGSMMILVAKDVDELIALMKGYRLDNCRYRAVDLPIVLDVSPEHRFGDEPPRRFSHVGDGAIDNDSLTPWLEALLDLDADWHRFPVAEGG